MSSWFMWKPYVPVAQRRAQARRQMEKLRKKGKLIEPVETHGRMIAETFWGQSWCRHLEKFSDFDSRLPKGRTYVRNGSVCHLGVSEGSIEAYVSGSELYEVHIRIQKLTKERWQALKKRCARSVGSLLEILQGRLSQSVMGMVTDPQHGLFPLPHDIEFDCTCPDFADMCKHVAAVLYGVGIRLDGKPELLFRLRGVDPEELVTEEAVPKVTKSRGRSRRLREEKLSEVFGIELAPGPRKSASHGRTGRSKRT